MKVRSTEQDHRQAGSLLDRIAGGRRGDGPGRLLHSLVLFGDGLEADRLTVTFDQTSAVGMPERTLHLVE